MGPSSPEGSMVCYCPWPPTPSDFTSPTSGRRPSATSVSPSRAPAWSRSWPSSRPSFARIGLTRVRPRFYLSTEWGVPFETVAIAIPFYLARPDLTALHAERVGHVEGFDRADILRYLRHEMGHVVNYAYRLYDEEEWVKQFGSITQPYGEEYRPEPFSRRYVRHLPGWYAQKHPDEDWSETFAVWMTPGLDWRKEYGGWPVAAAKLAYCERVMAGAAGPRSGGHRPPIWTRTWARSSTRWTSTTGDDPSPRAARCRPGSTAPCARSSRISDGGEGMSLEEPLAPAAALIRRLEPELMANVFRWTGHFPERTRVLLRYLAERAAQLQQGYRGDPGDIGDRRRSRRW